MVNVETILQVLPPYKNKYAPVTDNQTVNDIIKAIKNCHYDFSADYDKIAKYFIKDTPYKTCKGLFDFLRKNTDYFIESEEEQTVKSPSAILNTGLIDCKGFALFSCGVLDAINRTGLQKIPYCYRFVSDSIFNMTPNHVFCVAFQNTDQEIYIDPIPQVESFNQPITYYFSQDKKIKAMSLFKVSGGLFHVGEGKLRDQMNAYINQYPNSFLYLFLPVGNGEGGNWATNIGWNLSPAVPNVPDIVKVKRQRAYETFWNWGMPTGLRAETDIIDAIRTAITQKLGMTPEMFWSKKLGVDIPYKQGVIGFTSDPTVSAAMDTAVPGSSTVLSIIGPILDTLVPDLTWTHQPQTFTPVAEDWAGSVYAAKFPTNVNLTAAPAKGMTPAGATTTQAGMNMLFTVGIIGAAIYFLTKKKR